VLFGADVPASSGAEDWLVEEVMAQWEFDANQGLKNHVAAGGLKEGATNIFFR
jgi:hypothetical protein